MWTWLHHILEPHCPDCREEREEARVCQSCEVLKHQIEMLNYTQRELIKTLAEVNKPETVIHQPVEFEPIKPKTIPWQVKRQLLEEEDRAKAKVIADNKKRQQEAKDNSIDKLEVELGVK
jgi:hypothetical protein